MLRALAHVISTAGNHPGAASKPTAIHHRLLLILAGPLDIGAFEGSAGPWARLFRNAAERSVTGGHGRSTAEVDADSSCACNSMRLTCQSS
jgi:hypothetical protein